MTFRRLKKVNSSGPETGPACQDSDIYFPSSKSDSCRTADLQISSSEVYSYKTLAYSGGTLPRNFKKVTTHFQNVFNFIVRVEYWFVASLASRCFVMFTYQLLSS